MGHRGKGLVDKLLGEFVVEQYLTLLVLSTNELQRVLAHSVWQSGRHDAATHTLAVTHDSRFGLLAQIAHKVYTKENGAQLVQNTLQLMQEHLTNRSVVNQRIHHIQVALANLLIHFHICFAALQCHTRCFEQLVGDATQGTHHDNAIITLLTDDVLYLTNTFY